MRIGFLGAGNMASAILRGMRDMEKGCYDISEAAVRRAEQELGARGFSSGEALCAWADIVVLAVKPQVLEGAVRPLAGALSPRRRRLRPRSSTASARSFPPSAARSWWRRGSSTP